MITWRDVLKAFIEGAVILLILFAAMWAWETQWKIEALQEDIEKLRSAQRPLVHMGALIENPLGD